MINLVIILLAADGFAFFIFLAVCYIQGKRLKIKRKHPNNDIISQLIQDRKLGEERVEVKIPASLDWTDPGFFYTFQDYLRSLGCEIVLKKISEHDIEE